MVELKLTPRQARIVTRALDVWEYIVDTEGEDSEHTAEVYGLNPPATLDEIVETGDVVGAALNAALVPQEM